jgi:hypothetical protein
MTREDPMLVPRVSLLDSGAALTLFRRTVMKDSIQGEVARLTRGNVQIALADRTLLQLGFNVLITRFGRSRSGHPVIKRIESFVGFLEHLSEKPSEEWNDFQQRDDCLKATAYAVAWCPLVVNRPFGRHVFIRHAKASPSLFL